MLRVALAGGLLVEIDGVAVDEHLLGGRQGRRLLAHLAWEGQSVHRDVLADGLWLGSLPRTWERTLSGVVSRLRSGLAEAEAGVRGEVIAYTNGCYTLVGGGHVEVDVREAAADLVAARQAFELEEYERSLALLNSILEVARLPLAPGEDADWADAARARHRVLLFDALDLLADTALAAQRYGVAESAAREAVHWEPLREAGHQRLLRVLSDKGDRGAALSAYSSCRRLLAEELGVHPSPETEAIYLELLGTEPAVADAAPADPGVASPRRRAPFPPVLQAHATRLFGREPALVWLWSLWRNARSDAPLSAVLHGPPGAGKRSLVAVFAREVYATGGAVWCPHRHDAQPTGEDTALLGGSDRSAPLLAVLDATESSRRPATVEGAALILVLAAACPETDLHWDADLAVPPLDRSSLAALLDNRLGRPPTVAELDDILSATGGWPGAVEAEISALSEAQVRALTTDSENGECVLGPSGFDSPTDCLP